jgi:PP-loop superfamily ATP-utilizing enzyme
MKTIIAMLFISAISRFRDSRPQQIPATETTNTYLDLLIKRQVRVRKMMQIAIADQMPDKQVQAMYLLNRISVKIDSLTYNYVNR